MIFSNLRFPVIAVLNYFLNYWKINAMKHNHIIIFYVISFNIIFIINYLQNYFYIFMNYVEYY